MANKLTLNFDKTKFLTFDTKNKPVTNMNWLLLGDGIVQNLPRCCNHFLTIVLLI
jgi:hypothetical protein